jgi:heme oxygenase
MDEHTELSVWLTQVERFLEKENYLDAIARAKEVVAKAQRALEANPSDEVIAQLLARGTDRLKVATEIFEEKNQAIAARRLSGMREHSET